VARLLEVGVELDVRRVVVVAVDLKRLAGGEAAVLVGDLLLVPEIVAKKCSSPPTSMSSITRCQSRGLRLPGLFWLNSVANCWIAACFAALDCGIPEPACTSMSCTPSCEPLYACTSQRPPSPAIARWRSSV
jgi:hypothetical protein